MKYIDVSEWQGVIDWEKVKPNIDGAILRAGWGKNNLDRRFAYNASECNRLGIPCGAYWFSYAKTAEEAKNEALYLIRAVSPYRMELPLAFDFEYDSVTSAANQGVKITKELASEFLWQFGDTVEEEGYWCLNYTSPDFLSKYYGDTTTERFGLWIAAWPAAKKIDLSKPPRKCDIWQWTSKGSIPGISGNVDINESYTDFPKIIKDMELNHLGPAPSLEPVQEVEPDPIEELARSIGLNLDAPDAPITCIELARILYKFEEEVR